MSDYVPWNIDAQLEFFFEMPTEQLAPLVPAPLQVVEPRPGVAILWVGLIRFEAGNLGALPAFHEATCSILAHPRVADGGANPDFAAFAVRVASELSQFGDWAHRVDHVPVVDFPGLRAQVDRARAFGAVEDDQGSIFTLVSPESEVAWREGLLDIQVFSQDDGVLWEGRVEWTGSYTDRDGPAHPDTRLYPHPFFGELDVRAARCFRQMYTAPSGTSLMKYHAPWRMRLAPSAGSR